MEKTLNYYQNNSQSLIVRYDNADMNELHQLLLKYVPENSSIIDIGFGSGRDLYFLQANNYDIWGIDPTEEFVKNIQMKYPEIKEHFFAGQLPNIHLDNLPKKFDALMSVAVFMHLKKSEYEHSVKSISNICKSNATVIISFSTGTRDIKDDRYFEDVDLDYLNAVFKSEDFEVKDTIHQQDSLKRNELKWVTVVYKRS